MQIPITEAEEKNLDFTQAKGITHTSQQTKSSRHYIAVGEATSNNASREQLSRPQLRDVPTLMRKSDA
jgi:hypothetical protein